MGGGVILYVHSSLQDIPCDSLSESGFENSLWYLKLASYCAMLSSEERLLVGVVYRSPSSSPDIEPPKTSLVRCMIQSILHMHLLIMGLRFLTFLPHQLG